MPLQRWRPLSSGTVLVPLELKGVLEKSQVMKTMKDGSNPEDRS